MTFGFRLKVIATHGEYFSSDETEVEIDLAAPIGRVVLRPWPAGAPFKDARELVFVGKALGTREQAERAGEALKNAIRLAAIDVNKAIDVGSDVHHTSWASVAVDAAATSGILLLDDVHGLLVYEETGHPRVGSARADFMVHAPLTSFLEALDARSAQAANVSAKRALACDLFAQARFESSPKSRHLTLVTALEVLSERLERSGQAGELVKEFRGAIIEASKDADPLEQKQLDSLMGGAQDLRHESIASAIRRLAASIPSADPRAGTNLDDLVRKSYSARSDLIHDGATDRDLMALLDPLQELVRHLCTTDSGTGPGQDRAES